jgi:hypothetical protein
MMSHRSQFALWGLISLLCMALGLGSALLAALVQRGIVSNFTIAEISFLRNALWLIVGPICFGFGIGWIALVFGRKLRCSVCGSDVLPPDDAGFRGLRLGPLIHAARGRSICPLCVPPEGGAGP